MENVTCLSVNSPHFEDIRRIRWQVFVVEQGVSPSNEFDKIDQVAKHFLARMDGVAVGAARLYSEGAVGRIGRVAVLQAYRGFGLGASLMKCAMKEADRMGMVEVVLHAQTRVQGFYERLGFEAEGDIYDEEGIPHITMRAVIPRHEGD